MLNSLKESYIHNRQQRVVVDGATSDWVDVLN